MFISSVQLNELCLNALASVYKGDKELYSIVHMMYSTGLRVNEILDVSKWEIDANGNYLVHISKSDGIRSIKKDLVNDYYQSFVLLKKGNTFHNYRSVDYSISRVLPKITCNMGTNVRRAHLFRYNYIRQLKLKGLSDFEIQKEIMHKNLATTKNYIYSPLSAIII